MNTTTQSNESSLDRNQRIALFFSRKHSVRYKKKMSGKFKFYISEKNETKILTKVLSRYIGYLN